MVRVAVSGAAGRMGTSILNTLIEDRGIEIVGATEISGHPMIGSGLGSIVNSKIKNVLITDDFNSAYKNADVVVDFTVPSSSLLTADYCRRKKKAVVIGTTGFSPEQKKKLEKSIKKIPTVFSPNMSIGVNLVFEVSKILADRLGKEFDVEIVEAHHKNKVDAPSGTAIRLAESVAEGLGINLVKYVHLCMAMRGI
ncbi:MAG: 4-hydroxy-tetrahydrodipicolinate reductase, partial [Thermodesulfobacteriota bacterium]